MNETASYPNALGPYRQFLAEFRDRVLDSLGDVTFLLYFIVAIILCGGFGIWVEVLKLLIASSDNLNFDGIQNAAFTLYPALIGASCMLLVLEGTDKSEKPKTAFSLFVIIFTAFISAMIGIFESKDMYQLPSRVLITFFTVFGLFFWCFANGNNPHIQTVNPDSAVGGDTSKHLNGNTDGFQQ